jgi:hypothetical protein
VANYHLEPEPLQPPVYPAQVTEWQTSDDVMGGPGGKANEPVLQLVQRTNWLRRFLDAAQQAIVALQGAFAGMLLRVSAIEGLLPTNVVNALGNINNADNLTLGTVATLRLPAALRNSLTRQTLTIRPEDVAVEIDFALGGIVEIEMQNTAPCALSFKNMQPGQAGEIYFTSIFGAPRVMQLPAASPRWELAFPDTRSLVISAKVRSLSYRVLNATLIRAALIRDFT